MTPHEHFQAGQLTEAIAAALEDVKKNPTDLGRRSYLCELLAFDGQLERADKQLEAIQTQDPKAAVAASLFRQLIRAETARRECFEQGRPPELLKEPTPLVELHLRALLATREGDHAEAGRLLAEADGLRQPSPGKSGETAFDDLRDLDDMTAPFFEVLTSTGKYYWVPIADVETIEFRPLERTRDLLWRRAHMVVNEGPDGEVFLPTIYPTASADGDARVRLGRVTDWVEREGEPVRGIGLRTFLLGDHAQSILELGALEFDAAAASDSPADDS